MDQEQRIRRLERQVRVLYAAAAALLVVLGLSVANSKSGPPDTLRVRQITVVDANGTERVWIGAPVPDPVKQGKQLKRKGAAAGIILLDADGDERGGFLTADASKEIWLGLDSKKGQEATFLANPSGGTHLTLSNAAGDQAKVSLMARPMLMLRQGGQTTFQEPREQ
jgi:hypothetical protein